MELGRIDPSMATFYNIQNGLVIGSLGEHPLVQKLARFEKIGCFALTEPNVGSGTNAMETTCKWNGDWWVLNGVKKWVGNSTWADVAIVWAKDVNDGKIKAFVVKTNLSGFKVEKIKDKFGLRVCQNGIITLNDVCVDYEDELKGLRHRDVLRKTRYLVACEAIGIQMGAYELALKYAKERIQFGKPIASFQLVQDLLAKMLANVTACQCMIVNLDEDMSDAQASLVKAFCTLRMRETVSWAREIFGANGMSLDYSIGRFFTDAEAVFTYEGSYQMNQLIVGKYITGLSAFV